MFVSPPPPPPSVQTTVCAFGQYTSAKGVLGLTRCVWWCVSPFFFSGMWLSTTDRWRLWSTLPQRLENMDMPRPILLELIISRVRYPVYMTYVCSCLCSVPDSLVPWSATAMEYLNICKQRVDSQLHLLHFTASASSCIYFVVCEYCMYHCLEYPQHLQY